VIQNKRKYLLCLSALVCSALFNKHIIAAETEDTLPTITVIEKRIANELPAAIKETPISLLRYHPQVDLQTRGLAETQADVSIRGGLFENTGVKVGAVNLFDPQTGHYTAGLPLPVEFLTEPSLFLGIDNSLVGFNSNVASIGFGLSEIIDSRSIGLGLGSDNFSLGDIHLARQLTRRGSTVLSGSASYSSSQGDGSRLNGDHDIRRGAIRLQRRNSNTQSDLVLSYQDKFFGWPGAYTGFATLPEIDRTQTGLLLFNHRQEQDLDNWWEFGSYFRALDDDYDFNRNTLESGAPGSFEHKTESYALALQGQNTLNKAWSLNYSSQFTGDELVRSTDLLGGDINQRRYLTLSAVPTRTWNTHNGYQLQLRVGANYAWSSEDADKLSPLLGITKTSYTLDRTHALSIEYSSSSQLPGYTVLKSGVSGLFGGNPELGREQADTLVLSSVWENQYSHTELNVFYRQDRDLVDWTFSSASPFARQANPVDINVSGLELLWQRQFNRINLGLAYTYLDKDADYGSDTMDASYYALNYANQRLTSFLTWEIQDGLSFKLDIEARKQEENALRSDSDDAFEASLGLAWLPRFNDKLRFDLIVDNLTNSNFEEFPGTPSTRRSVGLRAKYSW